jgi:hypothetical protein
MCYLPVMAGQCCRAGFDCRLPLSGSHTPDKGVPFCLKVHKIDKLFVRILSQVHLIFSGQLVHGFMNNDTDIAQARLLHFEQRDGAVFGLVFAVDAKNKEFFSITPL